MSVINIEKAEIKTASIQIKSLMINNKQVTLSVFRQIRCDNLIGIDENSLILKGEPWGFVNYFWGEEKYFNGLNVIWGNGYELRRWALMKVTCTDIDKIINNTSWGNPKIFPFKLNEKIKEVSIENHVIYQFKLASEEKDFFDLRGNRICFFGENSRDFYLAKDELSTYIEYYKQNFLQRKNILKNMLEDYIGFYDSIESMNHLFIAV